MKESWKLLELLNEYEAKLEEMPLARRKWREESWILYRRFMNVEDAERMVISKSFWFIKWLVDNDKININEEWNDYEKTNLYCNSDFFQLQKHYSYYESLLMLLSISDTPIEDLILYLK